MRFGITANTAAEPAGQPHQVSVFERLIGARQRPPPYTEPARIMAHAEVCVEHNAIDAIVAAAQQILIESAQPVRHGGQVTGPPTVLSNCPAGATFSQPGLRKSVASSFVSMAMRRADGLPVPFVALGAAGADLWVGG